MKNGTIHILNKIIHPALQWKTIVFGKTQQMEQ